MAPSCFVCKKSFDGDDDDNAEIYGTKCGHIYHHQCLFHWMEWGGQCPKCGDNISPTSVFKIYIEKTASKDSATRTLREDLRHFKDDYVLLLKKGERREMKKWNLLLVYVSELRSGYVEKEKCIKQIGDYFDNTTPQIDEIKERVCAFKEEHREKRLILEDIMEKVRQLKIANSDLADVQDRNKFLRSYMRKLEHKVKRVRLKKAAKLAKK